MFAWSLACLFGVIGAVAGNFVTAGSGKPISGVWLLGFGLAFAVLGALLGGSMDIVNIIKQRTQKPVEKTYDRV